MSTLTDLDQSLDDFVCNYVEAHQLANKNLHIEYDPDWPSECVTQVAKPGEIVEWRPVKRKQQTDYSDIEQALEIELHPSLKHYYSAYWSDNLSAQTARGNLQLLFAWNQDDFIRYQQNLVGHILMKQRTRQDITLFFGLTDEDDFILTVHNQTGEVMLEQVGLEPQEVLAESLTVFLQQLQPRLLDD